MEVTRRQFVTGAVVSLGGLAGCTAILDTQADISVYNKTPSEVEATIEVRRLSDGKRLLQDSFTLPAGGPDNYSAGKKYREVVGGAPARVRLAVQDGPEGTYEFVDEERTDAKGLFIDVRSDSIAFQEVVR